MLTRAMKINENFQFFLIEVKPTLSFIKIYSDYFYQKKLDQNRKVSLTATWTCYIGKNSFKTLYSTTEDK